jgi:hypothetical protein
MTTSKLVGQGGYVSINDEMTFPNPANEKVSHIEWKLRYAPETLTRGEELIAASVFSAYKELVMRKSQKARNMVCTAINKANN